MPRGQVNLLSCAKIVASLSYYQQGKGLGDALMHLIPPPTHLAYYQQGKGAADALMHIVLQPPPPHVDQTDQLSALANPSAHKER